MHLLIIQKKRNNNKIIKLHFEATSMTLQKYIYNTKGIIGLI